MQANFQYLFEKYLSRKATKAELKAFYEILDNGQYDNELLTEMDKIYDQDAVLQEIELSTVFHPGANERMLSNILSRQPFAANKRRESRTAVIRPLYKWAAAIAIISLSFWAVLSIGNRNQSSAVIIVDNDVPPGRDGATLRLANGTEIKLNNALEGELAREAGIKVKKTAAGELIYEVTDGAGQAPEYNTLSTAKGETYRVRLSDGSLVFLNSDSRLTYSSRLSENGIRKVKLSGEAYFEVAKDAKHPFVVVVGDQKIQVLGTHFNVQNYGSSSKTTLVEGSVKVSIPDNQVTLKPGQQASIAADSRNIEVTMPDLRNVLAWTKGSFRFRDESLPDIMEELTRWYNVEIVYKGPVTREKFNGTISRSKNISETLGMLSYSGDVKFKIQGRRIIVTK